MFVFARILAADHDWIFTDRKYQGSNEREGVFLGGGHSEFREIERAIGGGEEKCETGGGTGYLRCCSLTGVRDALINVLLLNAGKKKQTSSPEPNVNSPKRSRAL